MVTKLDHGKPRQQQRSRKLGCERHLRWPKMREGKRIVRAVHFPVTKDKEDASARGQVTSKIYRLKAHGGRTPNSALT